MEPLQDTQMQPQTGGQRNELGLHVGIGLKLSGDQWKTFHTKWVKL